MVDFFEKNKIFADLALVLTAVIWGSGFIAVRIATDAGLGPEGIMFLRNAVALLTLVIALRKHLKFTKTDYIYGCITGLFLFLAFYSQTVGLKFTSTSNNAFLTSTYVIMVPIFEWIVFRKRPRIRVFFCAALAMFGIGVLTGVNGVISLNTGDVYTLVGSVMFSCHIISTGVSAKKVSVEKLLFLQIATCTALSFISLIFNLDSLSGCTNWTSTGLSMLFLGVFSTSLAFFFQTAAQKFSTPTKVTVILSTESLFACLLSTALGYDPVTVNLIFGGVIILLAVVLLDINFKRFKIKA